MKVFKKIVIAFVICFLATWFIDIHFFRGYYFNDLTFLFIDEEKLPSKINFCYKIERTDKNKLKLKISNNDFAYRFIPCYREDLQIINMNDWVFLYGTSSGEITSNGTPIASDYDIVDCGTGLATVFLRPFESFETELDSISQLTSLNQFIYFALYDKAIPDSISIRLAFPVNGLGKEASVLSSNLAISTSELRAILGKQDF